MSKRQRRKSRKLSEADEITPPPDPPTRKRRRLSSLASTEDNKGDDENETRKGWKREEKFVVSLQHSAIGTRFMTRLQKRTKTTPTSHDDSTPSPLVVDQPIETTPTRAMPTSTTRNVSFKNTNFVFSFLDKNKKRNWKTLKQILQSERSNKLDPNFPGYTEIEAPPPLKPPKKYSDISGLLSPYTDPLTGLQYSDSQEFEYIRTLPTNIVQGYLGLRGKATIT